MEASIYRLMSWVSLAVMQLRREAATWWRSLDTDPWQMTWSEFIRMFLAQFPPLTYPRGPSSRIDDVMARFATQHAIFDQIIDNWGQIPDKRMTDYIERFERNFIRECPYRLSENRKCRLFWCGVPFPLGYMPIMISMIIVI